MKHNVSAAAANAFWALGFKSITKVQKEEEKKVPLFTQQRRKLLNDNCPDVKLEHWYKNKSNGEVFSVKGSVAPVKNYERNPKYEKLFDTAHVEVNFY